MASVLPKAAAKQYRSRSETERGREAGKYKRSIDVYDLRRIELERRRDPEYSTAEEGGIAITLFLSLQANTSATSKPLSLPRSKTRRICKASCLPNGNGVCKPHRGVSVWRSQPVIQIDSPPWFGIGLLSSPAPHSFAQQRCLPFVPPPPLHSASSPLHAFHYGSLRSANTTREHNLRVEIMPPPRRRTEKRGKGGGEPASAGWVAGRTATVAAMWVVITNNQPTNPAMGPTD